MKLGRRSVVCTLVVIAFGRFEFFEKSEDGSLPNDKSFGWLLEF